MPEPLSADTAAALAEFARACKAAARTVSLYPGTHPTIRMALARVTAATGRLTAAGDVTLTVHPDALLIDGRSAAKPDPAIGEFGELLHERLVGALTIERDADADDWLAMLLLLSRAPEEVIMEGGIGKGWAATGRSHFGIREIDYAEVLRERAGSGGAEWDRIIAFCLEGESGSLDERAISSLLEAASDPERFGELLDRLQNGPASGGASMTARAAALLSLLRNAVDAAKGRGGGAVDNVLQTLADSSARLTPDMLLALLAQRQSPDPAAAQLANDVVERMSDNTIASFVAQSVVAERAATERLAHAFEALVPEDTRKERLLQVAHDRAAETEFGREEGFESLWQNAASMLLSYTDDKYVSDAYSRELSGTRTQAIDVERLADDPPERVQAWLSTLTDAAVRHLDRALLLDLLQIESDPDVWRDLAGIVAAETERRTLLGNVADAQSFVERLVRESGDEGRPQLKPGAEAVLERLASGPLVRHLVLQLRKVEDADVEALNRLCHTLGARMARPLAEALAVEENSRTIRRMREILLAFGAAGRQSVEQLKLSSNPAVRRTAIDLLRVFGGREALPELASMLNDADPQVQRESIRAIVQIGTEEAYAVLEHALVARGSSGVTITQQLIGLRDEKATPLLCYVLNHTQPHGRLVSVHMEIIEALGSLGASAASVRTLRTVLYRGDWWAPFRTASLRHAAATALRRVGTAESLAVLDEAATQGSRGVRAAARAQGAGGRVPLRPRTVPTPPAEKEQA